MAITRVFAPFLSKSVETNPDGSPRAVLVSGKVTGDQEDLDQQIVDRDWAREAMGEWHARAGNIREMHQASAVGKGLEWDERQDGIYLTSRITDPIAMQKCVDGVYIGYSVGIKRAKVVPDPQARQGRIKGGIYAEISVVDAPCLPDSTFGDVMPLWKMAGADGDEDAGAGEQVAEGDGIAKTAIKLPADGTEATTTLEGVEKAAIPAQEGEPQSPPKGYPEDKGEYGDPENYSWPLDKPARVRSAMAYYNAGKGKAKYSAAEWTTLGRRIVAKAKDSFGGNYTLHDGEIARADEADKALDRDILDGDVPVLVKGLNTPVLPNARWADVDGSRVPVYADVAYDPFPAPPAVPVIVEEAAPPAADTPEAVITKVVAGAATIAAGADDTPPSGEVTITPPADDPATIEKNGIATGPLGLDARKQIYELLLAEVTEDGGEGCCIYDIQNILGIYMALCGYLSSEAFQAALVSDKALMPADQWDTLLDAILKLRPEDAAALDAARLPHADATKAVAASPDMDTLTRQVEALTAERDDLQKQLDFSPAPGGPLRFAPPRQPHDPKDGPSEADLLTQQKARIIGQIGQARDFDTKQALVERLAALG